MDNWIVVLNDGETFTGARGTLLLRVSDTDLDHLAGGELIANIEPLQSVSIERLREERDEARRMYCEAVILHGTAHRFGANGVPEEITEAEELARRLKWDCFKEDTND